MKSDFIQLLRQKSGTNGFKLIAISVISGVFQGLIVVIINGTAAELGKNRMNFWYLSLFVTCITGFLYTRQYSLSRSVKLVQDIISDIRIQMADKVRKARLISIEKMGHTRILTTMVENTEIIFEATKKAANGGASIIMIFFSCAYMWYISPMALLLSFVLIILSVAIYLFNQDKSNEDLWASLEKEKEFSEYLNHLLQGFKEIKMNSAKSDDLYHNYLKATSDASRHLRLRTEKRFIGNYIFSQTAFYIFMGSIIFVLPQISNLPHDIIIDLVAVNLFIIGPLGEVIDSIPLIAKADIAVRTLRKMDEALTAANDTEKALPQSRLSAKKDFATLSYKGLWFTYGNGNGSQFSVGPLDLKIKAGELIFIVGGNGSGKSTLMKLLIGLYYPQSGAINVDDVLVDETNYPHFRDLFSIIFTDYYLFDRLYGLTDFDEETVFDLITKMNLSEKTSFKDGRFTHTNLSTGQKKRLGLIVSYLENKPILAFDEVAADQDPNFRKFFYEVLLKDLKQMGKTIIIISHDDRYFHVADRILKMDYGRFTDL